MTRQEAELELARRQQALLEEIVDGAATVVADVGAVARTAASRHPYLLVGGGVAAGALLGGAARVGSLRRLAGLATSAVRVLSFAGGALPV